MPRCEPHVFFLLLGSFAAACGDDTGGSGGAGTSGQAATTSDASGTASSTGTGSALCPHGVSPAASPDPGLRSCVAGEACCSEGGVYCVSECGDDPTCPLVIHTCEGEVFGAGVTLAACTGGLDDYRYTPCEGQPPCQGVVGDSAFLAICYLGDWNPFSVN